jgi:hypothetical protein
MTSEHARETVETIDRSTVRERGRFLEFQKTVKKNTKLHLYKVSGNNNKCVSSPLLLHVQLGGEICNSVFPFHNLL